MCLARGIISNNAHEHIPVDMRFLLPILLFLVFVPTLCQAQSSASEGDVVISEIMYAPDGSDSDREYIEVYNTTNSSIDLENWVIVEEDPSAANPSQDDINSNVTVEANAFAVLCENDETAENGGVNCAYDYANSIDHTNAADYVVLEDPNGTEVDRVRYDENGNWPDVAGASLEYLGGPDGDNNTASNWQRATDRAGDFAGQSGDNTGSPNVNTPGGNLPVELVDFTVVAHRDRGVLRWTTASETNNSGFAVQHRAPGSDRWVKRGFQKGAGTTTEARAYQFETNPLRPGTHTFRLKQIDLDGTAHYSQPRAVQIRPTARLTLSGPNPLPAGHSATVTVQTTGTQRVDVALFNALGQRVQSVASTDGGSRGVVRAPLATESLASGVYVLRVMTPSSTTTRRVAIVQ
jgi:hypothetical protein